MQRTLVLCGVTLALLCACETTSTSSLPAPDNMVLRQVPPTRAWLVVHEGGVVGSVVRYQEEDGEERFLYAVRNVHHQDLGLIDAQGRAFRNRAYRDAEWLGTGTVPEGVRRVLDLGADVELREVPLDELEAPATTAE